jgi:hypothetical protein
MGPVCPTPLHDEFPSMPLLADFIATVEPDCIRLPDEIAAALHRTGVAEVRVRLESPTVEPALLAARGIDDSTVATVAGVQKIEREIAAVVLAGEGIAHSTELGARLQLLTERAVGRSAD